MAILCLARIVEGDGEMPSIPVLLRRLVALIEPQVSPKVFRPIKKPKGSLLHRHDLENAVELACRQLREFPDPGAVLIIIDSDKDCPKELAPALLARAEGAVGGRYPIGVVLPKCEFENWFIAAAESVAGYRGLKDGLIAPPNPESIRDAKGWLRENMPPGRKYSETIDQPALASIFDLTAARQAPSFDKLCREVARFCAIALLNAH